MNAAPLELLDKAINKRVKIVMRNNYEVTGILKSFDEFVNCILEDAKDTNNIGDILLNGSNICIILPEVN